MADITKKCKEIIQELENNIKDSDDLEFAKQQVFSLLESFLEEIESIQETAEKRVEKLIQNQSELDRRLSTIEKDIYEEEGDFEISCPYCNHDFLIDYDELKNEVICPECNNTIELDWNEEHDCSCCHEDCEDDCHHCDDSCDCEDCDDDYEEDEDNEDM